MAVGSVSDAQVKLETPKKGAKAATQSGSTADPKAGSPADYVDIAVSISADTLTPGGSAAISVLFEPDSGYHVNAKPPMKLELDAGSLAALKDTIVYRRAGKTDYLDASKAVTQRLLLGPKAPAGPAKLSGTLTYYFCSDVEGWCIRQKHPFSVPVVVRAAR